MDTARLTNGRKLRLWAPLMPIPPNETLPAEMQIALAHTRPNLRDALRIFFELDHRLARILAATTEPMLGQMRLSWWRDMLGKPVAERPNGDVVLDGIGRVWGDNEPALIALVDGWEQMLAPEHLEEADARGLATGRRTGILAAYAMAGHAEAGLEAAALIWAFADMAANISSADERELLLTLGQAQVANRKRLSKQARGLAVLGALGERALERGGRPLMEGRAAPLVATRAAILGK